MALSDEQRQEHTDAAHTAQMAILRHIEGNVSRGSAESIRNLAEAYAWIRYPNQPHGSSTTVKS